MHCAKSHAPAVRVRSLLQTFLVAILVAQSLAPVAGATKGQSDFVPEAHAAGSPNPIAQARPIPLRASDPLVEAARLATIRPTLALTMTVAPAWAEPGDVVTFTVELENRGRTALPDVTIADILPEGLSYVDGSARGFDYRSRERRLVRDVAELTAGAVVQGAFQARLESSALGSAVRNVVTATSPVLATPMEAAAVVDVVAGRSDETVVTPEEGGLLRTSDDRILLSVPPGAVDRRLRIAYSPQRTLQAIPSDVLVAFDLEASDELTRQRVSEFSRPIRLSVSFRDLSAGRIDGSSLYLVNLDLERGTRRHVPFTMDRAGGRLIAELSHFSTYGITSTGPQDLYFQPRIEAAQTALFTGDSSYEYELETPTGTGGLKVPITLRYNGGIPNGMTDNRNPDGGWVGVGWTLDLGQIQAAHEMPVALTLDGLSTELSQSQVISNTTDWMQESDLPALCVFYGPANQDLSSGWTRRRWRGKSEQFAKIESNLFRGTSNGTPCETVSGLQFAGQWDVWAKDGTRYTFGRQRFALTDKEDNNCNHQDVGTGSRLAVWKDLENFTRRYSVYKLDRIMDTHGNSAEIFYTQHIRKDLDNCNRRMQKEAYPKQIQYTTNGTLDTLAEYEIDFTVTAKDHDNGEALISETGFKLDAIGIWYRPGPGADRQLIRRYEFVYYHDTHDEFHFYRLDEIRQFGPNNEALPTTTFEYYYDDTHAVMAKSNSGCGAYSVVRPLLHEISNGYGGNVSFEYESVRLPSAGTICDVLNDQIGVAVLQKVQSKTISTATGYSSLATYDYDEPAYQPQESGADPVMVKSFIGFGRVTEDLKNGSGQILRRTESLFHNADTDPNDEAPIGDADDPLKGKPKVVTSGGWNGTTWQEHTETETTYQDFNAAEAALANIPNWPEDVHFVYPSVQIDRLCDGATCQSKKTTFHYSLAKQDVCGSGGQYGNLTTIYEYADAESAIPYRTTLKGYCPNTNAWIIDRPAFEEVYAGGLPTGTLPDALRAVSSA